MFGRLKDWRLIATSYDRCPKVYLSAVVLPRNSLVLAATYQCVATLGRGFDVHHLPLTFRQTVGCDASDGGKDEAA